MSVHKTGTNRWKVRWREGGRGRSRTFDRKRDADRFDADRKRQSALGAFGTADPSPMLLEEFLEGWFRTELPGWKPSTRRTYTSAIERWIVPYVGEVRLRDLGHARVRRWRDDVLADACPPTQANKAARVLSSALGLAVREGLLPANPVERLRRIAVGIARPRALTPEEVERLRAAMPTLRDVVLVGLLAYAGLRPGEALALRWSDVTERVVIVDRALSDGVLGPTKTHARRTVDLIGPLAADLALARPRIADPEALVVPNLQGGFLNLNNWRRRVWNEACEAAEVENATPYDGRHTLASLLIHEGRSLPFVTAALGHGSATTTLRHYSHLFDDARLAPRAEMEPTVAAARAALEARGVYPVCTGTAVRVLRATAPGA